MSLNEGAIKRIEELAHPTVRDADGTAYWRSNHQLVRPAIDHPTALEVSTLAALRDIVLNEHKTQTDLVLHVVDSDHVRLMSTCGELFERHVYANAHYTQDCFSFGVWHPLDVFLIRLATQFEDTPDRAAITKLLSHVSDKEEVQFTDDGLAQTVSVTKGVSLKERDKLPVYPALIPMRTFPEIEQISSRFLLRYDRKNESPVVSLHEADGGAWRLDAIRRIADHMRGWKLEGVAIYA